MDIPTAFVLALALVYLPLLVAVINRKRGGGIWKFLTFWLCTSALAGIFLLHWAVSAVAWFLAWVFAAIARSSARRREYEGQTLQLLRQQNRSLHEQHEDQLLREQRELKRSLRKQKD
jgi:hypothetical protein